MISGVGRFWLAYLALWALGVVYASSSHAGYYARVTVFNPGMNYTGFALGAESGCYLTPSMAIFSIANTSYYWSLTALDSSGSWAAVGQTGGGGSVSGTFGLCTAQPSVTNFPPMSGGVTDPAISGDSVLSGSGGSSGGSADMEALFGWDAAMFELGVKTAFAMMAIGLGVGLIISLVRKMRT